LGKGKNIGKEILPQETTNLKGQI